MKKGMAFRLVLAGVILMSGLSFADDLWEVSYERTTVTTYYPTYPVVETRTYYVSGPTYVVHTPSYVSRTYVTYGPSFSSPVSYSSPIYSSNVTVRSYSFDW